MEQQDLITSGTLELYVYGTLPEAEQQHIATLAQKDPMVMEEIVRIETALVNLSAGVSPTIGASIYHKTHQQLFEKATKIVPLNSKKSIWSNMGWAAAILLVIGGAFTYLQLNNDLQLAQQDVMAYKEVKEELAKQQIEKQTLQELVTALQSNDMQKVTLPGQAIAPDAQAQVFWNKKTKEVMVDIANLPPAPEGKVYQIWALKLNPLTPTSIGLLSKPVAGTVYKVSNTSNAEAFGITLEVAGGSATPTLEQLYAMGKV